MHVDSRQPLARVQQHEQEREPDTLDDEQQSLTVLWETALLRGRGWGWGCRLCLLQWGEQSGVQLAQTLPLPETGQRETQRSHKVRLLQWLDFFSSDHKPHPVCTTFSTDFNQFRGNPAVTTLIETKSSASIEDCLVFSVLWDFSERKSFSSWGKSGFRVLSSIKGTLWVSRNSCLSFS